MNKLSPSLALFTIIVLEGYVVLSLELLAMRQTLPYVGSGTDTISIIIAGVLMPLAFGYQAGGGFKSGFANGRYQSIREKLLKNMFIALAISLIGSSFIMLFLFFETLRGMGINHRLTMISIYVAVFLVVPVFLLGQTIPLISNYFGREKLAKITGRILLFSTIGSFLGAVFTTIVLMSTIGVLYTAVINFFVLAALITLLAKNKRSRLVLGAWVIAGLGLLINSGLFTQKFRIVNNNTYNTAMVFEFDEGEKRIMYLNNNPSSMYIDGGKKHQYVEFVEEISIETLSEDDAPRDILVLGAGGFTFGSEDRKNNYDFVDIDKDLLEISETYLLKHKLSENKTFHPVPARAYLNSTDKKYDLIFVDAFQGDFSSPEHLVTHEFFQQVKSKLKDDGTVVANVLAHSNFSNTFSVKIDNTLRSVFPHVSRHVIGNYYAIWADEESMGGNAMYIYNHTPEERSNKIYTDNKNTVFWDKPQRR